MAPFPTFTVPITDANAQRIGEWPCQKPPWGCLNAINPVTGEFAWQVPLGITEQLPPEKQHTGRATGLVFIPFTDDDRFHAIDSKTGRELWIANRLRPANPMTYRGRNGKQYVAVVSGPTLNVLALP